MAGSRLLLVLLRYEGLTNDRKGHSQDRSSMSESQVAESWRDAPSTGQRINLAGEAGGLWWPAAAASADIIFPPGAQDQGLSCKTSINMKKNYKTKVNTYKLEYLGRTAVKFIEPRD